MQLFVNVRPDLPDGGPYASMNPGSGEPFGIIEFGDNAYVSVKTDDEARRIIEVAAALIAMRKMLGTPHAHERGAPGSVVSGGDCLHCGMLGDSPDHAEPEAVTPGCDCMADAPAPAAVLAEPKLCEYCDVEPATEGKYCEACAAAVALATACSDCGVSAGRHLGNCKAAASVTA